MTTAVIYARLSDVRKGDAEGIDRQVREARAHAERLDVTVMADPLIDNDISAASRKRRRPAFQRLMEGIAANEWDVVILRSLDRWVRRPAELEEIIEVVERSNVRVEAIHGTVDLKTRQGRLSARLLTAVAMSEVEATQERVLDWHADRAARGLPHVGSPGYGFQPDKVSVNPVEAERIVEAARRVLAGEALAVITAGWNNLGVPGPRGRWRATALRRILLSPRTAGLRSHHGETVPAVWPAILDRDTWDEVGRVLRRPERRTAPSNRGAKMLTGIASCGKCLNTLNHTMANGSRRYFCRHCFGILVFAERLEQHVVADLCSVLDTITVDTPDTEQLAARVLSLEGQLDDLAAEAGAGTIELREWKIARTGVTERLDAARSELAAAGREMSWVGHGDLLAQQWEGLTVGEQRRILTTWITEVRVDPAVAGRNRFDPDRVTITYRR